MTKPSNDAQLVTINALANMVRLLAAELVAGSHRDDIDQLEHAVRAKLANIDRAAFTPEAFDKGMASSRDVVEQVLAHVRAQSAARARADAAAVAQAQAQANPPKRRAAMRPKVPTQH
jgi:hypothetical protein